jgi:hypothetical protein
MVLWYRSLKGLRESPFLKRETRYLIRADTVIQQSGFRTVLMITSPDWFNLDLGKLKLARKKESNSRT